MQFGVHLLPKHNIYRKSHVDQQWTSYASAFRKSAGNAFSSNLETFPFDSKLGKQ